MGMGPRRRYARQSPPRTFDPNERRYYVYRLSDASGGTLYVGRSADPRTRLTMHRASAEWAMAVREMDTWGPYTWAEAIAKERERIEVERPPHNRQFLTTVRRQS